MNLFIVEFNIDASCVRLKKAHLNFDLLSSFHFDGVYPHSGDLRENKTPGPELVTQTRDGGGVRAD